MDTLDLLDELDRLGASITLVDGRLVVDAPAGTITEDHATKIRANRDLVVAVLIGRRTGHAFAPCTTCHRETLTPIFRSDGKPRDKWPTCRMTPGCDGRHEPRADDVERTARQSPPAQAPPPSSTSSKRLLGEWPTWPNREGHRP